MSSQRPAAFLAAFLGLAGVMHFARPKFFDTMVPKELPGTPRQWTHASGVVELTVATAIAVPKTRKLGGLAAALMFLGVFPANVKQALDAKGKERAVACARLPVQWPLVAWALKVRDNA
ncbi:DoxX family protein [Amycolatopsis sp. NPDC059657]|uniref:DoxX family protein n=1 Tax=Amycolatopsis sp. NPDC059657 TaxID=3346899 RepID=UPI0036733426